MSVVILLRNGLSTYLAGIKHETTLYEQFPFRYRLKIYALFTNGKMRLRFIQSSKWKFECSGPNQILKFIFI